VNGLKDLLNSLNQESQILLLKETNDSEITLLHYAIDSSSRELFDLLLESYKSHNLLNIQESSFNFISKVRCWWPNPIALRLFS
jgi:hypothetical protein